MQSLFGHFCSGTNFVHDQNMRDMLANDEGFRARKRARFNDDITPRSSQNSSSMVDSIAETSLPPSRAATNGHIQSSPGLRGLSNPVPSSTKSPASFPSSLKTTSDIVSSSKGPLLAPESSPRTKKARHNEIRQAWKFLSNARSDHAFHNLGPLPSSCLTEPEDESNYSISHCETTIRSHIDETMHIVSLPGNEATFTDPEDPPHSSKAGTMDLAHEDDDFIGESQISHTLSVPSSAFASQEQVIDFDNNDAVPPSDGHSQNGETEEVASFDMLNQKQTNSSKVIRPSLSQSGSSLNRKAAYLAARADSFDAWASMSLVSAGNNHTEEEIEL